MPEHESITEESPDEGRSREETVLRKFRKSLSQSGGGGGVSLHLDADIAREYRLDDDTEVEVAILDEDGDVAIKIGDIPAGFKQFALEEYADRLEWELTDSYETDDEWSVTYRDPSGLVRIEVDSTTHIDGAAVNNVFIQGEPLEVDEDLDRYRDLCVAATRKDLRVRVQDSEGLWQRLRGSADHDTDDAPDEATFQQLLNTADSVTVQLVKEMASLHTTLDDIGTVVKSIREVMVEYSDTATQPA